MPTAVAKKKPAAKPSKTSKTRKPTKAEVAEASESREIKILKMECGRKFASWRKSNPTATLGELLQFLERAQDELLSFNGDDLLMEIEGELSDAASALDWLQSFNREAKICWIAGVSFGAWISMQLLMRRPEISGFISVAPLAKHYDFSFLAPCPASGLFVNGEKDTVTPPEAVHSLVSKLKTQKGIAVEHKVITGANHFFQDKIEELTKTCSTYLDKRLAAEGQL